MKKIKYKMSQKWLEMKERGNALFKSQNYSAAADYYTKGE